MAFSWKAQWEYACRARTTTAFAFGDTLTTKQANFASEHPVAVDSFEPNAFGLYNMHGNVIEWCRDRYQEDFYQESAGARDPLCENSGSEYRVMRGGSWSIRARACRSACRLPFRPSVRTGSLGFRPAWSSP